jgi:hypothetical protein
LLALTNDWLSQGRQTPVKQGSNRNIKRMSVLVVAPSRFEPINAGRVALLPSTAGAQRASAAI